MASPKIKYIANRVAYAPGARRVYLTFEERMKDLSGLLDFGTVIQIFPEHLQWQVTTDVAGEFLNGLRGFIQAHDYTDLDSIAAIGDPAAIAALTYVCARANGGRVRLLRWDRLPCPGCGRHAPVNPTCPEHTISGRYLPVEMKL